jgi:cystathionine beta-lyase
MSLDFKTRPDRKNTGSLKWDKYQGTDILPMWVADMDFPVATEIQKALQKKLSHPVYGYTIATKKTSASVVNMLQEEFNWKIDPEWLVWLPGVVAGLWGACAAFGEHGDEAIFNTPIYHHFFDVPAQGQKKPVAVPLKREESGRWTYDFDALQAAVSERSKLMLLCSPHNPTGTLFTEAEIQQMGRFCEKNDLIMVSDEIHCGLILSKDKKHVPAGTACPDQLDRMVTIMSPSKTFNLAGINCSFAIISNPEVRKQFNNACHSILPMVPGLAYTALESAYSDGKPWQEGMLEQLRENHAYLEVEIESIPGLKLTPMEATYLAWINTDNLPCENAVKYFESFGVGLSPGSSFGMDNYVRINFACPMSMLKEAVKRMKKAVAAL